VDVLALVNLVLTLLDKFVSWGQRSRVFNEDQSIIALTLIRNAQRDIAIAQKIEKDIVDRVSNDPTNVVLDDEFTRK
jgi:hypothetical protein